MKLMGFADGVNLYCHKPVSKLYLLATRAKAVEFWVKMLLDTSRNTYVEYSFDPKEIF